jgi:hypothetical protein
MLWVPAASDVIVNVTAPLARADVPSGVEPSSSVTLPAAAEPAAGVTESLKVTLWPTVICAADAERLDVVAVTVAALGWITNKTAE